MTDFRVEAMLIFCGHCHVYGEHAHRADCPRPNAGRAIITAVSRNAGTVEVQGGQELARLMWDTGNPIRPWSER